MVGILVPFWDDLFSGAMLVSGRVYLCIYQIIHIFHNFRVFNRPMVKNMIAITTQWLQCEVVMMLLEIGAYLCCSANT